MRGLRRRWRRWQSQRSWDRLSDSERAAIIAERQRLAALARARWIANLRRSNERYRQAVERVELTHWGDRMAALGGHGVYR